MYLIKFTIFCSIHIKMRKLLSSTELSRKQLVGSFVFLTDILALNNSKEFLRNSKEFLTNSKLFSNFYLILFIHLSIRNRLESQFELHANRMNRRMTSWQRKFPSLSVSRFYQCLIEIVLNQYTLILIRVE